uniref:Homing endonuclease n=1 Tax=Powellomyces hirtus TaxID=109895 RepID=A0A4P8NQN3_9FUNG|nr:Homing endonuclease [Powellomyces hirtus]
MLETLLSHECSSTPLTLVDRNNFKDLIISRKPKLAMDIHRVLISRILRDWEPKVPPPPFQGGGYAMLAWVYKIPAMKILSDPSRKFWDICFISVKRVLFNIHGKRFLSTAAGVADPNDHKPLNPNWVVGFVDAEGCFTVVIGKRENGELRCIPVLKLCFM